MLSIILFITAIIGALFFPKVILIQGGIGTESITVETVCGWYVFIAFLIFVYRRKETPFYGKLWQFISLFFMVLFGSLLGGFIKEQVKKKDYSAAFFGLMIPFLWFINKSAKSKKSIRK